MEKKVMKQFKNWTVLLLALIMLFTVPVPVQAATASIKLNTKKVTVAVGKTYTLKATVTGKSQDVVWSSSNKNVATVTSAGKVKGVRSGVAVITAKANGKTAKCTVKVYPAGLDNRDFTAKGPLVYEAYGKTDFNFIYDLYVHYPNSFAYISTLDAKRWNMNAKKSFQTFRGIKLGDSMSLVKRVYSNPSSSISFSKSKDKLIKYETNMGWNSGPYTFAKAVAKARYVYVYNMSGTVSSMRFYFNSEKKLISVAYVFNYDELA